ncbi:aldo/keto reductase [Desulfolucanica intricata]|uniref:aldo/keto reductase n=1 Tax=Desulfolucanica intricata TaxID=1285191 RepID=UPI00082A62F1|nr:aldo/keto reductase [Desulfolucanica intricata]
MVLRQRVLGNTTIKVSRLCFGALTIGPLQANLPVREGAKIIRFALESGVNFIDTAKYYGTYPYIREALKGFNNEVVIVSKSYDYTYEGMRESVSEAIKELGRDYIDIFMLHEQESHLTIRGHWDAVKYLLDAKKAGLVRAIGISTHHIAAVKAAAEIPEIEVIHPLINIKGIGIQDGTVQEMLQAIELAHSKGKGIYGMKSLGGGNLLYQVEKAQEFVLSIDELAAVAVGMRTESEVSYNVKIFSGEPVSEELTLKVRQQPRRLHIEEWCERCGKCVERCQAGALSLEVDKIIVDQSKCRLCGYCSAVCPQFCIKVI